MEAKVGSIAEGKAADLVIFSGTSPGMVAAAQHDPVAAVILHSNPNDVEYVVIDGVIRKRASKLIDVTVDKKAETIAGKPRLVWDDVAKEVITRRDVLQKKIEKIDMKAGTEALIDMWYIDRTKLVDNV